jgi:hypothetical protein
MCDVVALALDGGVDGGRVICVWDESNDEVVGVLGHSLLLITVEESLKNNNQLPAPSGEVRRQRI